MRPEPILLHGHDEQVAEWVSKTLPDHDGFDSNVKAIGIFDAQGSRILAGVVYHNYERRAQMCGMSIASESPMFATKGTIRALMSVPFEQFGCFKVCAITRADNKKAQKFLEHVGFIREVPLRHHFGRRSHGWLYSMTLPEYRRKFGV